MMSLVGFFTFASLLLKGFARQHQKYDCQMYPPADYDRLCITRYFTKCIVCAIGKAQEAGLERLLTRTWLSKVGQHFWIIHDINNILC